MLENIKKLRYKLIYFNRKNKSKIDSYIDIYFSTKIELYFRNIKLILLIKKPYYFNINLTEFTLNIGLFIDNTKVLDTELKNFSKTFINLIFKEIKENEILSKYSQNKILINIILNYLNRIDILKSNELIKDFLILNKNAIYNKINLEINKNQPSFYFWKDFKPTATYLCFKDYRNTYIFRENIIEIVDINTIENLRKIDEVLMKLDELTLEIIKKERNIRITFFYINNNLGFKLYLHKNSSVFIYINDGKVIKKIKFKDSFDNGSFIFKEEYSTISCFDFLNEILYDDISNIFKNKEDIINDCNRLRLIPPFLNMILNDQEIKKLTYDISMSNIIDY